ncbi:MAG: hypothetical protein WBM78_09805 [Desulfobacterales bacterium]
MPWIYKRKLAALISLEKERYEKLMPLINDSGVPELQLAYDEMIKFFKRHLGI